MPEISSKQLDELLLERYNKGYADGYEAAKETLIQALAKMKKIMKSNDVAVDDVIWGIRTMKYKS